MAQAEGAAKQPSVLETMFPMILVFAVFYFLIILPQRKHRKKHQEFLTQLKRGDEVLTTGGIWGKVDSVTDQFVTLEVSDDVKIKVLKSQVAGVPKEQTK